MGHLSLEEHFFALSLYHTGLHRTWNIQNCSPDCLYCRLPEISTEEHAPSCNPNKRQRAGSEVQKLLAFTHSAPSCLKNNLYNSKNWTECGDCNREVRERTLGAEGVCIFRGRTKISTKQNPQRFKGHQPKFIQRDLMAPICMEQRIALSGITKRGAP